MTGKISKITVLSLFAAACVALPALSQAQGAGTNAPAASGQTTQPKLKKTSPPFHGKLKAVDAAAKTLSVGTLILQVTPDTKITKDGNPASLTDGVVGEPVSGNYKKSDDGKLTALTVHFGAKAKTATSAN